MFKVFSVADTLTQAGISQKCPSKTVHCAACRSINRRNIPAADALLMSLFSSLPNMPSNDDPSTLRYTVAVLIGAYAGWLAATVRVDQRAKDLVSQLLQLLMAGALPAQLHSGCCLPISQPSGGNCPAQPCRSCDATLVVIACDVSLRSHSSTDHSKCT